MLTKPKPTCYLGMFFFLMLSVSGFAQYNENYFPLRNYKADISLINRLNLKYDSIANNNLITDKKSKKELKEAIKYSKASLKSLDSAGYLMKKDNITIYLQKIADNIQKNNDLLKGQNLHVFTYRTEEPNASNRSAGLILFNLDLLSKMDSEEETAFILCHEISHDILGHVVKGMLYKTQLDSDPKYKAELKKINNQEFNRLQAYEKLYAKYLSEYTSQRRSMEIQADSLGLLLYLNCGYNSDAALSVITKLDSVDQMVFRDSIPYSVYFDFKNYPFKKSWLENENTEDSFGGNIDNTFEKPDSLKTHPDSKIRVEKMKDIIAARANKQMSPALVGNFTSIREQSIFEMIEYFQQEYFFSQALFYSISMLKKYPGNKYLHTSIVNCFAEISIAQKNHYFSKVVEYPNDSWSKNYYRFLIFLHNTNSDILDNLRQNYYSSLSSKDNSIFAEYVNAFINGHSAPLTTKQEIFKTFKAKFNDSYYTELLEKKLKLIKTK